MKWGMDSDHSYAPMVVANEPPDARMAFIRKTYWHLAAAIGMFALLETLLFQAGCGSMALQWLAGSKFGWLAMLGGFMAVSWIADKWARSATSLSMQYVGLSLYVLAEAVIFLPLIALAPHVSDDPFVVGKAGMATAGLVLGLTVVAFTTRKDFTFLGGALKVIGMIVLGLIVASFFLPVTLGLWFSAAMVVFAACSILYSTSAMLYHYEPSQHVAAALGLFASVALMFWYILRIFMNRD